MFSCWKIVSVVTSPFNLLASIYVVCDVNLLLVSVSLNPAAFHGQTCIFPCFVLHPSSCSFTIKSLGSCIIWKFYYMYLFMEEVFYMFWILFAKCDPDICINFIWTYILTVVDYVII